MSQRRTPCSRAGGSLGLPGAAFAVLGSRLRGSTVLGVALLLTACAKQVPAAVSTAPATPGFLLGLWHGFIFPIAWVLSLFVPDIAIYAVPNTGGWYDFGYFVGIVFLGVGARRTRTVYVSRRARG